MQPYLVHFSSQSNTYQENSCTFGNSPMTFSTRFLLSRTNRCLRSVLCILIQIPKLDTFSRKHGSFYQNGLKKEYLANACNFLLEVLKRFGTSINFVINENETKQNRKKSNAYFTFHYFLIAILTKIHKHKYPHVVKCKRVSHLPFLAS